MTKIFMPSNRPLFEKPTPIISQFLSSTLSSQHKSQNKYWVFTLFERVLYKDYE